jgi:hypothetical protein
MNRILPFVTAWLIASCSTLQQQQIMSVEADDIQQESSISELEIGQLDDEVSDDELEDLRLTLDELVHNPINVNSAQFEDLMRIPAMRPSYARAILRQRDRLGRYSSKGQFQSVPGVPQNVMSRMSPYLTLGTTAQVLRNTILEPEYWTAGLRLELLTRIRGTLEKPVGYRSDLSNKERVYPGPPVERYQRITARSRHFSAGVQFRGAPGAVGLTTQPILRASHVSLSGLPLLGNAVIGRYRVAYGMGLAMNGGRAPRRGFDMRVPRSSNNTVSAYAGSSYSVGHTGFAISTGGNVKVTYWMSHRKYTGTSTDSSGMRWGVSEPLFRTPAEIERRDNFSVQMTGIRGSVRRKNYQLGLAGWSATTSQKIKSTSNLYPEVGLHGRHFGVLSADFDAKYRNGSISSELALDAQGGKAAMLSGEASLGDGIEVLSSGRFFGADYRSPFGSTYSNWSGRPSNEVGWLVSFSINPNRQTRYSLFSDVYSSLLPRSSDFMPTTGSEIGVKLIRNLGQAELQLLYRNRIRDEELDAEDIYGRSYRQKQKTTRSTTRVDIITSLSQSATWVTRAEWVWAAKEAGFTDNGYLIHQDLSWRISSKTRLQARVTIFNTTSYTSRIYAWEPDVGLASSMPSFQGEGGRTYLLATYKPKSTIEGRIKIARTQLPYSYSMGSGNDLIQDNKRTQLHTSLLIRV